MSGPPRTPTALRKAKGNPGKRAYNKREPKTKTGRPDLPGSLVGNATAIAEWNRLCNETISTQVLTKEDRSIVELAALAYAEYMDAREIIERDGTTYETTNTQGDRVIKKHPACEIRSDAWRRYRAAICELGLTPSARARVSVAGEEGETDPAAGFFN